MLKLIAYYAQTIIYKHCYLIYTYIYKHLHQLYVKHEFLHLNVNVNS